MTLERITKLGPAGEGLRLFLDVETGAPFATPIGSQTEADGARAPWPLQDGRIGGSADGPTYDLITADRVLDRCPNVIDALVDWMGALKDGGVLDVSVANRRTGPDRSRLVASPTHFLWDYVMGVSATSFESREHVYSHVSSRLEAQGGASASAADREAYASGLAHIPEPNVVWHAFNDTTLEFVVRAAAAIAGRQASTLYQADGARSVDDHRLVVRCTPTASAEDAAWLRELRVAAPGRIAQFALKLLEGKTLHSLSRGDVGKVFFVENGQARWVREAPTLTKLGVEGQETAFMTFEGLPGGLTGRHIASATIALSESRKDAVLDRVPLRTGRGLEMSPGARPIVDKSIGDVVYCDKVDVSAWKDTYKEDLDVYEVEVLGEKMLDEVFKPAEFDYLVSSHVIEHIPDFIQFFKSASTILKPGGKIVMLAPDRRFTFDLLRADSSVEQIEIAHREKLRHPSWSMIEDFFRNVDNNANAAEIWAGTYTPKPLYGAEEADTIIKTQDPLKVDLHCWTFTPESFRRLLAHVVAQHAPQLRVVEISDTPFGANEFLVELQVKDAV